MPDNAVANLRNAESNALSRSEPSYGSTSDGGFYTGSGRNTTKKKKFSIKGRTAGAIISITLLLGGGAAFLGSSNSLIVPAIEALVTESTDTQYSSSSARSAHLFNYYLKGDNPTHSTWTGAKKYNHISNSFEQKLAKQGITIEGKGANKTLNFTDKNGVTKAISAGDFNTAYVDNADFREAFTTAKRGRVATFFDDIADRIYQKLGLSRNLFNKFQATNDTEVNTKNYKDTLSPKFDGDSTSISTGYQKYETNDEGEIIYDIDADGNEVPRVSADSSTSSATTSTDSVEVRNKKATDMLSQISATVGQVGTWACTIARVGNMISVTVAANEIYQSINYFMGLAENISKTKAGYGDQSAIHEVLNFLSTPDTTTTQNLNGKLDISTPNTTGKAGELIQTGTPLESNGLQMMLAGAPALTSTTTTFSIDRIANAIPGGALFGSAAATAACAGYDIVDSIVSIGVQIASGGLSKIASGLFKKVVLGMATQAAAGAFFSFLVPTIAQSFFSNAFETATGVPAGELFARGASASNTRLGRSGSGQSLSSADAALAYNQVTNQVLALDAEIDRKNLSPFDISNKNTFFGSITYSLLPTLTSSGVTSLSSLLRSTSSSLSSLLGKAHAAGENSSYMTTFGDCPTLEGIGAKGDIYCNPITSTDVHTIDLPPDNANYTQVISDAIEDCDEEGNGCKIKKTSDLAKYVAFCDNRDSPFGVVDQNILGGLQQPEGAAEVAVNVLSQVPIIGDVINILDSVTSFLHLDWATGKKCGNTSENADWWEEKGQYYQRYVEDQRLLENMGAYEDSKNPVTAFIEEYDAAHPINDYTDYIARISGLTRENAEIALAFIEYYNFIDQYDPTVRIAMTGHTSEIPDSATVIAEITSGQLNFSRNSNHPTPEPVIIADKHYIAYADLRNRSYAA